MGNRIHENNFNVLLIYYIIDISLLLSETVDYLLFTYNKQ